MVVLGASFLFNQIIMMRRRGGGDEEDEDIESETFVRGRILGK